MNLTANEIMDARDVPIVRPAPAQALIELAVRAPMHPLPSAVQYARDALHDPERDWTRSHLRWWAHRANDAASVAHIPFERP